MEERCLAWTRLSKAALQGGDGKAAGGGTLTASGILVEAIRTRRSWFSELLESTGMRDEAFAGCVACAQTARRRIRRPCVQLHTGSANAALTRPSMWVLGWHGLGAENRDLPGYVTVDRLPISVAR